MATVTQSKGLQDYYWR